MRVALLLALASMPAFAHHHHITMMLGLFHRPAMTRSATGDLILHHGSHSHVYDHEAYRRYLGWVRFQPHVVYSLDITGANKTELNGFCAWLDSPQGQEPPTPFKGRAR